jgi:hypothetical protein
VRCGVQGRCRCVADASDAAGRCAACLQPGHEEATRELGEVRVLALRQQQLGGAGVRIKAGPEEGSGGGGSGAALAEHRAAAGPGAAGAGDSGSAEQRQGS